MPPTAPAVTCPISPDRTKRRSSRAEFPIDVGQADDARSHRVHVGDDAAGPPSLAEQEYVNIAAFILRATARPRHAGTRFDDGGGDWCHCDRTTGDDRRANGGASWSGW
jgi:hypothetical protein